MAIEAWNPNKQLGELALHLKSQRVGNSVELPSGVKIGVIARGRRGASAERQYAVVEGQQRKFHRSASEAAADAMERHKLVMRGE